MPQNPKVNFIELLKELFQLNNTDLDFGIYRILKLRSRDVEEFINIVLPQKLEEVKNKLTERASADIKRDLENVTTELTTSYGDDFETKVEQFGQIELFKEKYGIYSLLKEQLDNTRISEELENDVYNDLYRFFERYYEGGDFVTKPRAGDKTYMIPYDGEEVKFYWANYDQYYIKTGENFKNYVFNNGEEKENKVTVEFRIKDVETTINNNQNQKGRIFIPTEDFFEWSEEEKKLNINFYYKIPDQQEKENWGNKQTVKKDSKGINERLIIALEEKINSTTNTKLIQFYNKEREVNGRQQKVFYYHLNRYTSLNKFDYFIHKDLRKFLIGELDYFLKNEILSINFLKPDWREEDVQDAIKLNIVKASVIRDLAFTIINFLSELEDFQRRLFEKKKYVVQSEYVMTMDIIPKDIYDEIVEHILNDPEKKQINEWVSLGFLNNTNIHKRKIENTKSLVIDSIFFEQSLKYKLLNEIDNIKGGLMINSDNWQGLSFLNALYKRKINCIYIDPPYNAKSSEIAYKNSFKHSSWIALMVNRMVNSKALLKEDGTMIIAIDENEQEYLGQIIDYVYPTSKKACITIIHNPRGQQGKNISYVHDFAYFIYPSDVRKFIADIKKNEVDARNLRDSGTESDRTDAKNCFYPIIIQNNEIVEIGRIPEEDYHPNSQNIQIAGNKIEVWPLDENGNEKKWRYARTSINNIMDKLEVKKGRNTLQIIFNKDFGTMKTVWSGAKYDASEYGTKVLQDYFGKKITEHFTYPKSIYTVIESLEAGLNENLNGIVLDYFAGSATTAQAVIELNKKDQGQRNYVLIEMGDYFSTVTKSRVQKIMFSESWKDGKPFDNNGYSHIFNYIKLEQYEDSLNNIVFDEKELELEFEDRIKYRFREGAENSASIMMVDRFSDPFNYQMEILQQNERKLQNVDLVTTFNFLLGIDVNKIKIETHQERNYRIIVGTKKQQSYLILWRKFDDDLRLDEERDWIKELAYYDENARKYCNGDNAFGAENIEAEFKRLMFEDVK